jgi:hypothetical protein
VATGFLPDFKICFLTIILKKIQKNPLEYIAIKFDAYVIFFQNYG